MVSRAEAVQRFVDLYSAPAYLEIGVSQGETFNEIRATRKVAVDPQFLFDTKAFTAGQAEFHEVQSDVYFGQIIGADEQFHVIYLDGLHTFEQTLRDLLNAIAHLAPHGVIVVDDTVPTSYEASIPGLGFFHAVREVAAVKDANWMGDVYRLVFFIQTFMQQFSYATIEENHGQTVLWREPRPSERIVPRDMEAITRLEYGHVLLESKTFERRPLAEIVEILPVATGKNS